MRIFILIGLVFLFGCAQTKQVDPSSPEAREQHQKRRNLLVGQWIGEGIAFNGNLIRWVSERKIDGSFIRSSQTIESGKKVNEATEIGFWGVSGDIYFILIREKVVDGKIVPKDTTSAGLYSANRILSQDHRVFKFKDLDFGDVFTEKLDH